MSIESEIIKAREQGISEDLIIREFFQKIFLQAISVTGAYQRYVFQGGTSIRLFYGSPRFSLDLDFTPIDPQSMSEDVNKAVKRVSDFAIPLGFKIRLIKKTLQRFIMIISSEKYGDIVIKIEFLGRQDKDSLKFITMFLESNYPIKTIYPIRVKIPQQLLADKIASFAGSFAKGIGGEKIRFRDLFDIFWLRHSGFNIDFEYFLEIFGSLRETPASLKKAIEFTETLKPKDIIKGLGVLIPNWLRDEGEELGIRIKKEALKVLKEAYSHIKKE